MKGLITTGAAQAKPVSDSLLLFRKEAAWKGKGKKKKRFTLQPSLFHLQSLYNGK